MIRERKNAPGRNDLCPCGSGLKYKRCCLEESAPPRLDAEELRRIQEVIARRNAEKQRYETQYGHVRPAIHAKLAGYKLVAVGNQVHWAKEEEWKTFPDFLLHYIKSAIGSEWGNAELAKPASEQHQIIQWYRAFGEFTARQPRNDDGVISAVPNGLSMAYLCLAYDLYALRHHSALQEQVVSRLKVADQFQGARYELFVAATYIRAGFDIAYEDESDGSQRHPEFVATHRGTSERMAVEAKSKHRPGVLGFRDGNAAGDDRARVRRLLKDALAKGVDRPYAIFVDLNLPPGEGPLFERPWLKEILDTLEKVGARTEDGHDRFNMLVLTNHPFHYGSAEEPSPRQELVTVISQCPLHPLRKPGVLVDLHRAAEQFGSIPSDFPERD